MEHSGWEKRNRANRQLQLSFRKFLLIILLAIGLLFVFSDVASTFDIEKTGFISGIIGNVPHFFNPFTKGREYLSWGRK